MVEEIEYRLKAPKVSLPGLDDAVNKLRAIRTEIGAVNAAISGLTTNSLFKRTRAELADLFKPLGQGLRKVVKVEDVANALGLPDLKDFNAYIAKWKVANKEAAKSMFASDASIGAKGFASSQKAAEFAQRYLQSSLRNAKGPVQGIQALFGAGKPAAGGAMSASGPLHITATSVVVHGATVSSAAGSGGAGGPGGPGGKGTGGGKPLPPGSGTVLETKEIIPAQGARRTQRRELQKMGQTIDTFFKEIDGELQQIKSVATTSPLKRARETFSRQMISLQTAFQQSLTGQGDPKQLAALYKKQADMLRALTGGKAGQEMEKLGLGSLADRANSKAAGFEKRAAQLNAQAQSEQEQDFLKRQRHRLQLIRNNNRAEERARQSEEAANKKAQADALKHAEKRARETQKAEKARQASADALAKLARGEAVGKLSHAQAGDLLNVLRASGFEVGKPQVTQRVRAGGTRETRTLDATKDAGGERLTTRVRFHFENGKAVGAEVSELNRKLKETRAEAGALGGDFVRNTLKVATWAASVGVLYKTLNLATFSMSSLIDTGAQLARLDQVFTKIGGSTQDLARDVIGLAAANGRTKQEAIDAAIQWSRLGLTRAQVNEAVRSSLVAANIAELSSAEATEKLSGIMAAYQLRVTDLRTTLAELNAVSNTFNVRNADMLEGLTRTASVARQAGLPLQELIGLVGATVGTTGQSGAMVGNMLKTVMSRLSDQNLQKKMRDQFRFEVTAEGGVEVKNMSALLSDLFVKFQDLSGAQRQSLLFQVAGATQVNRLSALLDSYVRAQVLAINAQLNLNSAEQENAKIKATLKSQLTGLTTEWERFVALQGSRGPAQAMSGLAETFRNVLSLMNSGPGSAMATGLLGVLTAAAAKVLLVGVQMKAASGSAGFMAESVKRVVGAMHGLNSMTGRIATNFAGSRTGAFRGASGAGAFAAAPGFMAGMAVQKLHVWSEASFRTAAALRAAGQSGRLFFNVLGAGLRTLSVATVAVSEFIVPLIAFYAIAKAFNMGMEAIGLSSEHAEAKMAGFNAEAERAKEAASAFTQAANLFGTAQRALANMRGSDDRQKFLSAISEAAFADEQDAATRDRKVRALAAELQLLERTGQTVELNARLEGLREENIRKAFNERQKEFEANRKFIAENQREVQRLKQRQAGTFGFLGADSRRQKIGELERDTFNRRGQLTQGLLEESNAYESRLDADERHNTALERQRLALDSIAELYRSIPTDTRAGAAQMELLSLEAQNQALEKRREILRADVSAQRQGDFERAASAKAIEGQIEEARAEYAKLQQQMLAANRTAAMMGGGGGAPMITDPQLEIARQRIEELERQRQTSGGVKTTEELSLERQLVLLDEQQRKLREQQSALKDNMDLLEAQDRMRFGFRQTQMDLTPFDVGATEIDRLMNRRRAIAQQMAAMTPEQTSTVMGRAKLIELENSLYNVQLDLRMKVKEAEREINQIIIDRNREFRNSILGAGPGEMLRKLTAMQMSQRNPNMSMGQFLSLGTGMRGDLQQLQPGRFDSRIWDLRNSINNAGPQQNDEAFFKSLQAIQAQIAEAAKKFAQMPGLMEVGGAHMELANQARNAASALGMIPEAVNRILEMVAVTPNSARGGIDLPMDGQMRGLMAGTAVV